MQTHNLIGSLEAVLQMTDSAGSWSVFEKSVFFKFWVTLKLSSHTATNSDCLGSVVYQLSTTRDLKLIVYS